MTSPLPLRADAARNRHALVTAAASAFAEGATSMRAVARAAGVGVGTLYRHFPTQEALVDAVYRDQADRLATGARELLAAHDPPEALRRWMDLFGEWIAAKQGMLGALLTPAPHGAAQTESRAAMLAAITALLHAGLADDTVRSDVDAEDVSAALVGILTVADDGPRRARLLDVLADGLRTSPPERRRA